MKVAIIGSRDLEVNIEKYVPYGTTVIISGGARGIDSMAEKFADDNNIKKIIFKPDYEKYGRRAPLLRDKLIVDEAELIIAIWDGKSLGTKFTIDYARKKSKKIEVFIV